MGVEWGGGQAVTLPTWLRPRGRMTTAPMPESFVLPRHERPPLEFRGVKLADVTSRESDQQNRWQEIRIYRTNAGQYVIERTGKSSVPGERELYSVRIYDLAKNVRLGLYDKRPSRGPGLPREKYLTDLAVEALEDAHEADPDIVVLDTEQI